MKHAKLSPSGANRWLKCPASIKLSEAIERKSNKYADRGTEIHNISEAMLNGNSILDLNGTKLFDGDKGYYKIDSEDTSDHLQMIEEALAYVDYIRTSIPETLYSQAELRVDLTSVAPDTFGTTDNVAVDIKEVLHIVDLKTGAVPVSATDNAQLKLYAYGAYLALKDKFKISYVKLHIFQNNSACPFNISTDLIDIWELLDWIDNIVKPKAKEALGDNPSCVAGESQCKYCPASVSCDTLFESTRKICEELLDSKDDNIQIDRMKQFLEHEKLIKVVMDSYRNAIENEMLSGEEVKGFKLVKTKPHAKWTDGGLALKKLKRFGKLDEVAPRKVLTPSQARKFLTADDYTTLGDIVVTPEGKMVVALESDRRPAVKPLKDMFEDLNKTKEDK